MEREIGSATWYVRDDADEVAYQGEDPGGVVVAGGITAARNRALKDAWSRGLACVQVSDDLEMMGKFTDPTKGKPRWEYCQFHVAVLSVRGRMAIHHAMLGGAAPTPNPLNFRRDESTHNFIVGDFIVVEPCEVMFDETFRLKEDYDYTLQHLARYGKVLRADTIAPRFTHRTNAGGAVDYRTKEREREAILKLLRKWGNNVQRHPRKPETEIVLRWKGAPPWYRPDEVPA